MPRFVSFCLCSVLLVASQAVGRTEYVLGGTDGTPWRDVLSPGTAGAYLVLDEDGRQVSTVTINTVPQQTSADTLIDFSGFSIQPISIDPMVNLTRGEPDNPDDINKVFLTYTGGEVSVTYGCRDSAQNAPFNLFMLDGKPATAQFRDFIQHPDRALGIPFGNAFRQAIIFDLGANVPINRIRFYPRLGREEDALLIQSFADPKPSSERFGEDSFVDNFVAWFEIRVGDNSLPYQNGPCGQDFYHRFGYVTCMAEHEFWLDTRDAERYLGGAKSRRLKAGDLPQIARIYNRDNAARTGSVVRNPSHWRGFRKGTWWSFPAGVQVVVDGRDRVIGYVAYDDVEDCCRAAEVGGQGEAVFAAILGFLTRRAVKLRLGRIKIPSGKSDLLERLFPLQQAQLWWADRF